jgi:hypothetical protein
MTLGVFRITSHFRSAAVSFAMNYPFLSALKVYIDILFTVQVSEGATDGNILSNIETGVLSVKQGSKWRYFKNFEAF